MPMTLRSARPATFPARAGLILLLGAVLPPLAGQGLHIGPQPPDPGARTIRPSRPVPPTRGLTIQSLAISVRVVDGIATTTLAQVYHNAGPTPAEATWLLPLPADASADGFTMTMNGRQVDGEVLDARRARGVYESIVRRRRDPGLLEYMGTGCLRARVFPIPARGEMRVEVRYRQILPETSGRFRWWFPVRAATAHGNAPQRIGLDLQIESRRPIRNVYSPNAGLDVVRRSDHSARASLELHGTRRPPRDFEVHYGTSDQTFGLDVLTYRQPGRDGYFLMLVAPQLAWNDRQRLPKCIQFVLDTSGSMSGKKIEQARGALRYFLGSLDERDTFNVIPFATDARPLFPAPRMATAQNVGRARELAAGLEARGGTNIAAALTAALQKSSGTDDVDRVRMTVFLTDGLPTVDTTDPDTLLRRIKDCNRDGQRIFVFGVGNDVNTHLLDKLAEQSRGSRDYVRDDESIEVKTSALFTKLSHPVMTKVRVDCDGIEGFDIQPGTTPDLFQGERLLLTGRYRGQGRHAVRLSGVVGGDRRTFVYEANFAAERTAHDFIPTLWAQRKIATLLDALRLNGTSRELVQEIRRLGAEHGIVTPYTSHLILEEGAKLGHIRGVRGRFDPESKEQSGRLREDLRRAGEVGGADADEIRKLFERVGGAEQSARDQLRSFDAPVGKNAVDLSATLKQLASSRQIDRDRGAAGMVTQHIAGHTFHLIGGVWVDGALRAEMKDRVQRVKAFSDEYFALLQQHPELAKVLAFSARILVVLGDRVIEIV